MAKNYWSDTNGLGLVAMLTDILGTGLRQIQETSKPLGPWNSSNKGTYGWFVTLDEEELFSIENTKWFAHVKLCHANGPQPSTRKKD